MYNVLLHLCIYVCIYACVYVYMHACYVLCTCVSECIEVSKLVYINIYIYYTYIYIFISISSWSYWSWNRALIRVEHDYRLSLPFPCTVADWFNLRLFFPNRLLVFFPGGLITGCPKSCNGRGDCVTGSCQCFPGYSGLDCMQSRWFHVESDPSVSSHPSRLIVIAFRVTWHPRKSNHLLFAVTNIHDANVWIWSLIS